MKTVISFCLVILTLTDMKQLQALPLCPQPVGVIVSLPWSASALINIADQLDQHPTVLSADINLPLFYQRYNNAHRHQQQY